MASFGKAVLYISFDKYNGIGYNEHRKAKGKPHQRIAQQLQVAATFGLVGGYFFIASMYPVAAIRMITTITIYSMAPPPIRESG